MDAGNEKPWVPTRFVRFEESLATSMCTAIVQTDAGKAYLKGLGNPEGPHTLVCEYVGTHIARLFGLKTLDFALIQIDSNDEIPLSNGGQIEPGSAFVTKEIRNHIAWSGKVEQLEMVENTDDIPKLVVFDTWLRNIDRYPPQGSKWHPNYDNVLLAPVAGVKKRYNLFAIDHTHCISHGRDIGPWLNGIDCVKDEMVYGLFPQFEKYLKKPMIKNTLAKLAGIDRGEFERIIESVPEDWVYDSNLRNILLNFICDRATYIADNMIDLLNPRCWRQGTLWDE